MVDQNKIILMTKLEMYNKKHGNIDRERCKYFLEDYIYTKNFITRIYFSLIILFFMSVGAIKILTTQLIIPESLEQLMDVYVNPYILPWVSGLVIYTLVSSWVHTKAYKRSKERLKIYRKTLRELDAYEDKKEELNEDS
ncbi:hypothetical protein [Cellulosilyticum ruminicola]|uniref:hypothetical protein n=1 Tax=Cellulosilyticum ruminicola TaxID=425254 RepID=UPI0006D1A5BF|nr:hypothetical protein [Cellulosilyticum ruminicola]